MADTDFLTVGDIGGANGVVVTDAAGKLPLETIPDGIGQGGGGDLIIQETPDGLGVELEVVGDGVTMERTDDGLGVELGGLPPEPTEPIPLAQKGAASGVATLDVGVKIPAGQIPEGLKTRSGRKPSGDRDNVFHLEDFGLRGGDVDADTQAWMDGKAAAAAVRGRLAMPTSLGADHIIGETLEIPGMMVIGEPSAAMYRFGPGLTPSDKMTGTTVLRRPAGATFDLMRTVGSGSTIQGITLHGGGSAGKALDMVQGFEVNLLGFRMGYFAGTAFDVSQSCNALWSQVAVENSGTLEQPAVVWNPRNGRTINTLTLQFFTIERCTGISLDIGPDINSALVEYVRSWGMHVESVNDNDGVPNTLSQIRVNNARQLVFMSGTHYGGPGALFEVHRTRTNLLSATVGITLSSNSFSGRSSETGHRPDHLIKAVKGDGLILADNTFDNSTLEPVKIESTFGSSVKRSNNFVTERAAVNAGRRLSLDSRTVKLPTVIEDDVEYTGTVTGIQPVGAPPLIAGRWYSGVGPGIPTAAIPPEGAMRGARFVCGRTTNIAAIGINVTVAGAASAAGEPLPRIRLGIYELNTTTGAATLLLDAGTVDGSTTGFKEIATTPLLTAGKTYLLVAAVQNGAGTRPTVQMHTGGDPFWGDAAGATVSASALGGAGLFGVTSGLPASPALSTAGSGSVPRVLIRA